MGDEGGEVFCGVHKRLEWFTAVMKRSPIRSIPVSAARRLMHTTGRIGGLEVEDQVRSAFTTKSGPPAHNKALCIYNELNRRGFDSYKAFARVPVKCPPLRFATEADIVFKAPSDIVVGEIKTTQDFYRYSTTQFGAWKPPIAAGLAYAQRENSAYCRACYRENGFVPDSMMTMHSYGILQLVLTAYAYSVENKVAFETLRGALIVAGGLDEITTMVYVLNMRDYSQLIISMRRLIASLDAKVPMYTKDSDDDEGGTRRKKSKKRSGGSRSTSPKRRKHGKHGHGRD